MRSDKGPWKDEEILRVGLPFFLFILIFPLLLYL